MSETKGIYKAITDIMAEVGSVGKNKRNQQQNYAYRGIDEVVEALQPLLAKHGVCACPNVRELRTEQVEIGKNKTPMMHVVAVIEYNFYAADGSTIMASAIGEATDSADKAGNKAMASAYKYALTQVFAIPTSDAKDTEDSHHELASARNPVAAKPDVDIVGLKSEGGTAYLLKFENSTDAIRAISQSKNVTVEADAYIKEFFQATEGKEVAA